MKRNELDDAVVIALGSNLKGPYGSTRDLLEAAVEALGDEGLVILARSSWWTSAAWPDPDAPPFLNGIVLVETQLGPQETLAVLHRIERGFGRDRSVRNAPRTLDLDLIAHGRVVMSDGLVLPHPRAAERRFVMGPLAEIAPDWLHPVTDESARALVGRTTIGVDAHPQGAAD